LITFSKTCYNLTDYEKTKREKRYVSKYISFIQTTAYKTVSLNNSAHESVCVVRRVRTYAAHTTKNKKGNT